ncbi:MAG: helix-turn-helix domain-containing protein [Deltaproteobacteria bacterium]|nr:helix-turn-helix domain-containing protein [Deltaproteobacteria bacterium]
MNCLMCNGPLVATTGSYEYASLPDTMLTNVEIRRCATCDEEEVVLPQLAQLNRVIAAELIRRPQALVPAQFRFLRKVLGWSGVDLARRFGTTKETVSRWENGHIPISPMADRFLRLAVAYETPVQDYRIHDLAMLTRDAEALVAPITVRRSGDDWRPQAA